MSSNQNTRLLDHHHHSTPFDIACHSLSSASSVYIVHLLKDSAIGKSYKRRSHSSEEKIPRRDLLKRIDELEERMKLYCESSSEDSLSRPLQRDRQSPSESGSRSSAMSFIVRGITDNKEMSSAPFCFTKIMKPVIGHLRSQGTVYVKNLDDFLIFGDSYHGGLNSKLLDEKKSAYSANPFFPDEPLCVASVLCEYIETAKDLKSTEEDLLFSVTRKPYSIANKQTISNWVEELLAAAGIDTYSKPHSTRDAPTSAALRGEVSLIYRTVERTEKSSTFAKFYNRPLCKKSEFTETAINCKKN
ncbi:hypothetical protein JTB14_006939 [Gonioctena quinquepunctata]|nr:hypothetical protein JTB14_006939 [Gonioctena quinquepunctata]